MGKETLKHLLKAERGAGEGGGAKKINVDTKKHASDCRNSTWMYDSNFGSTTNNVNFVFSICKSGASLQGLHLEQIRL